ncbi:MAG TPA: TIGR03118 family protein [Candidatus Competibacteraceae bacterium]|nr:TIGR03118 family protein [Candidatus Competibacteraceae bacterium]
MALPAHASNSAYEQKNLVSDQPGSSANTDPKLVNAWGIAFNPNALAWVANAGTGTSTLYDGAGKPSTLIVAVPDGNPTGIVFNGSNDFIAGGNPSRFIFATESGTLAAWAPAPSSPPPTVAVTVRDNASSGAIYKGLALAANGAGHFLYATDFHNNKIDVFDKDFKPVALAGSFSDPTIPPGFAPFGIQNLNGDLYVTYAQQDPNREDDVAGRGLGFVNVFDASGHLVRRFASRGNLNAPWGLAIAPASFGQFGNRLLVGNFGDGAINAYDLASGKFRGQLQRANRQPVRIDGLWGLSFGNGVSEQPTNTLFFTAGPDNENHGLYGRIDVIAGNNGNDDSPTGGGNGNDDSGNHAGGGGGGADDSGNGAGNDDPGNHR